MKKLRKCAAMLLAAFLVLTCILPQGGLLPEAYAATTWSTLPSSTRPPSGNSLNFSKDNVTVSYGSAVTGRTVTGADGTKIFCIKITPGNAATYTNPITLNFTNVGEIGGRKLNCKVAVTQVKIAAPYSSTNTLIDGSYLGVLHCSYGNIGVASHVDMEGSYRAAMEIDTRVTITYADTGATVTLPFYQGVDDIDAGATGSYYREGIEFMSGYSSNIYKWPQCILSLSGNKASATAATSGSEDIWYKAGLIAPTTGGDFTCRWYEGSCTTYLSVFGQYLDIQNPTKTVDKQAVAVGETLTWTISQKLGTFFSDTYNYYSSLVLRDVIPTGLKYESAKVYDGSGGDITGAGTLTYDNASRTVSYSFPASQLNSQAFYNGQTVKMVITTTAEDADADRNITNTGEALISGLSHKASATSRVELSYAAVKKSVEEDSAELVAICPDNYSLAGAEYGVYASSENANADVSRLGTIVTGAGGSTVSSVKVVPGHYYIKELKAPAGYALDDTVYETDVTRGQTATVSASDEPLFASDMLLLTKIDADKRGYPIEGAEFIVRYYKELTDDTTGLTPVRTWKVRTDKDGKAYLSDDYKIGGGEFFKDKDGNPVGLIGTYEYEEVSAPRGYALLEGKMTRQLTAQNALSDRLVFMAPDIDEHGQTVSIKVTKIDAQTGEAVPQGYGQFEGAEYTVAKYNELWDRDDEVGTITIGADGTGTLGNLNPGLYKVYEKKAPKGYLLNDEVRYINAGIKEENTANFEYAATSKETVTLTKILKIDAETGEPVKGAELALLKGDTELERWTSGETAHEVKGLAQDEEYTLREIAAPDGYVIASDLTFTAENKAITEVSFEDDYIKVDIAKVKNESGECVPGASMQLRDETNEKIIASWRSESTPKRIDRLPAGTYYIHEERAPSGYFLAPDKKIVVEAKSELQSFTVEDDYTRLEVKKVDIETGEPVIGATLAIYKAEDGEATGEALYTWESGDSAERIDALAAGEYILRELKVPEDSGYVTASDMPFTLENTTEVQEITMEDDFTRLSITSSDLFTGDRVASKFGLFKADKNGQPIGEALYVWEAGDEAFYAERLPVGDYVLRELTSPDEPGFVTSEDIIIHIGDEASVQSFDIPHDHTRVEIRKLGEISNKLLAGAKLRLLDADGNVVSEWMSSDKTAQVFEYLPVGTYTVQEVSAPAGYTASGDITFTVKDDAAKKTVIVRNYKIPRTGDNSALAAWAIAALTSLLLLAVIGKAKERR